MEIVKCGAKDHFGICGHLGREFKNEEPALALIARSLGGKSPGYFRHQLCGGKGQPESVAHSPCRRLVWLYSVDSFEVDVLAE